MLDNLPNRPNHIIRTRLLPLLSIHLGPIPNLIRIPPDGLLARNARPNRRKPIEALRVSKLPSARAGRELEVARRDVVADGVAEDVLGVVCSFDVFPRFADHDGEFAFVVELGLAVGVDGDGGVGAGEGGRGLHEDGWVGGDGEVAFFGVLFVVEADAENDWCVWKGTKKLYMC